MGMIFRCGGATTTTTKRFGLPLSLPSSSSSSSLLFLFLILLPLVVQCYSIPMTASISNSAAAQPLPPSSSSENNSINSNIPIQQTKKRRKTLVEHFRHRGSAIDMALGVTSHVGAAVTAVVELGEDFEAIGHGHGMLLLVGSRLAREFNMLRSAVVEEVEELTHLTPKTAYWWRLPLEPFYFLGRILASKFIASLLACAALFAAALEVVEDSKPGGHHGAVLLAINELWELLELSNIVPKAWRFLLKQHLIRLILVTGALVVAVVESVEEHKMTGMKVGGHHGVAMFAFCKILRVVALMRTEMRELAEMEEERHHKKEQ